MSKQNVKEERLLEKPVKKFMPKHREFQRRHHMLNSEFKHNLSHTQVFTPYF